MVKVVTKTALYEPTDIPGIRRLVYSAGAEVPIEEYEALSGGKAPAAKAPTKKELTATAAELGITVPAKATNDEIAAMIDAVAKAVPFDRGAALVEAKTLGLDVDADATDEQIAEALAAAKAPAE